MELEDRLKNLARLGSAGKREVPLAGAKDRITDILNGSLVRNEFGEFVSVRKEFDPGKLHGDIRASSLPTIKGEFLTKICSPRKAIAEEAYQGPFDLEQAVFFDCETTGLAGGAGTYAFLVGLGYLRGGRFCVEQYFMEDFHQERAVLSAIAEKMNDFRFLVSYNGKCFDLPLLENRWTINRIDFDSGWWLHLDLLYPSRRLWKRRIGDCSLGNIERKVLGVGREIDVPGYMVPQIYFDYLRTGEAESLIPVFHHNSYDIVSLLRLAVMLDRTLETFGRVEVEDPIDLYSLGRIHQNMGNYSASVRCFKKALASEASLELQQATLTSLAFAHKRSGALQEAAGIWQTLTRQDFPFSLLAHEELAKYYEHKIKDHRRALLFVEKAMAQLNCDLSPDFASRGERRLNSLEYRRSRLQRKIKKTSACPES
jgi:uncharacterized protein YprB with RNaseH-like and TPR domain